MKDRILLYLDNFSRGIDDSLSRELMEELKMDPQTFRNNSEAVRSALLHNYDDFAISTIDAFFQKVIRAFTREAGLVGDYRLEVDQEIILEEVIDNLIDELGEDRELTDWVVKFARENLENERPWDVRYSLIAFAAEIFREEFKEVEGVVNSITADKGFFRGLRAKLGKLKSDFLNNVQVPAREIMTIMDSKGWGIQDIKHGRGSGIENFLKQFGTCRTLSAFKEPGTRIRSDFLEAANWPSPKTSHAADIIRTAADEIIPRIKRILDVYDTQYRQALSAEVALSNLYVFGLISDISRKLKEYKDENNVMLLADAPKFLQGVIQDSDTPFIYEKVGSFYRNYLIDEFQDTSGLQWKNFQPLILNSLDQGYPSLVVGDVKQAIYRWRGGDLSLLQQSIVDQVGAGRVEIQQLDTNFRSSARVVQFNNALFSTAAQILALDTGTALPTQAYEGVEQKIAREQEGYVSVRFLDDPPRDDTGKALSWRDSALQDIPRVLELLQERGVALSEIAILVRRNEEGQRIAAFLLEYKNSSEAKSHCSYDVVSNESLRIDGAASVNLLLGALRYLLNTDDSIARAQLGYEYARLHEPERDLLNVFEIGNQATFENNLPPSFAREKARLRKLPLIELTESLIDVFKLGTVEGELVYLQAFQDLVLEFSNREKNDLGAFLEWWDVFGNKKSIQLSGDVNAVQILTIHKSKGLQFPYVIIPFCMWSLDHESWKAPNLWVKSDEPPFADAGVLPVRYAGYLANTCFADDYAKERMRIHLDNLNLLYVAFTRAEKGLWVSAPSPQVRSASKTVAELLYRSLERAESLTDGWDSDRITWVSGEINVTPGERDSLTNATFLREYRAASWRDRLVIRHAGASWFDGTSDQQERINYGIYMHAVLSQMHYSDELGDTLEKLKGEGLIKPEEAEGLMQQIKTLLEHPQIADWFSRSWHVRTEVPIILPGGDEHRLDRLMTHERRALVVDFKTGVRKKRDETQVLAYMDVLRQMNYTHVEGYLLYLAENQVVEVTTSKGRRVMPKVKDKDQLDLGL